MYFGCHCYRGNATNPAQGAAFSVHACACVRPCICATAFVHVFLCHNRLKVYIHQNFLIVRVPK